MGVLAKRLAVNDLTTGSIVFAIAENNVIIFLQNSEYDSINYYYVIIDQNRSIFPVLFILFIRRSNNCFFF